jgi:hypothetical protein
MSDLSNVSMFRQIKKHFSVYVRKIEAFAESLNAATERDKCQPL